MKTVTLTLSALLIAGTAFASPIDIQGKTLLKDFNSSRTADSR